MKYTIAAIPTKYNGVQFRSRLEARWAAFFDLLRGGSMCDAPWKWAYEPIDLDGWIPDFKVGIPCAHSGCNTGNNNWDGNLLRQPGWTPVIDCSQKDRKVSYHSLLIEVKPYDDVEQFASHPMWRHCQYPPEFNPHVVVWGDSDPHIIGVGTDPSISTKWGMGHGDGGGEYELTSWIGRDWEQIWNEAGNLVQYRNPLQGLQGLQGLKGL